MQIYIIVFLATLFLSSSAGNLFLFKKYQNVISEKEKLESLLEMQNQAIKQLEIDTEAYKAEAILHEQQIKAKYENVQHKNTEALIDAFFKDPK